MGAGLLARLIHSVAKQSPFATTNCFWMDSMTTLAWIKNYRPWKMFVRNRVNQIRKLTSVECWQHCQGDVNPADLPTRGISGIDLINNKLWWEGPAFLKQEAPLRPTSNISSNEIDCETDEVVKRELAKTNQEVTHSLLNKVNIDLNFINFDRFSSRSKLIRTTAFVLRFVHNLKCLVRKKEIPRTNELGTQELLEGERVVIKSLQAKYFWQELHFLSGFKVEKIPAYVKQFNLFVDQQGLIRCQSRLQNANANAVESTPILIPTYCSYAELLIKESHEKVFHNGIAQTLCYLRSRYWIPRLRELIKKYLRRCSICKRLEGKFFEPPPAPPLPDFRVSENPPFSNVGLDFIGPLLTRLSKDNEVVKSYICLFTCCSTRGIHLETCESLHVSSFRLLFRQFCSRRGLPVLLLSDNASTFKSASQEIRKIARSKEIKNYVANKGIT